MYNISNDVYSDFCYLLYKKKVKFITKNQQENSWKIIYGIYLIYNQNKKNNKLSKC